MSAGDTEFDLLNGYIDGELSAAESELLARRLAENPSLAQTLDLLRAEQRTRQLVFASLAPSAADASAFARSAIKAARREERWSLLNRVTRRYSAAAALILVGFLTGWLGRGGQNVATVANHDANNGSVAINTSGMPFGGDSVQPAIASNGGTGIATFTSDFGGSSPAANEAVNPPAVYRVEMIDALGRPTGERTFTTLDDAKAFAWEMSHARPAPEAVPFQQPVQPRSSGIVPASYEEY